MGEEGIVGCGYVHLYHVRSLEKVPIMNQKFKLNTNTHFMVIFIMLQVRSHLWARGEGNPLCFVLTMYVHGLNMKDFLGGLEICAL